MASEGTPLVADPEARTDLAAGAAREERPGLTDDYTSWSSSRQAKRAAALHFSLYLFLAVVGFSFVVERWTVLDSLYFAVVLFTTVGYGDLSPLTNPSRCLVMALGLYGIVILGIFLSLVGDFVLERYEKRREAARRRRESWVLELFGERDCTEQEQERSFLGELGDVFRNEAPLILFVIALGAPIPYLEGWDVVMGLYWMMITGTTVGFGDLQPSSVAARGIAVVWIPLAVAMLGKFLGQVAGIYLERRNDAVERRFLARAMTLSDVRRMDTDRDGRVSPEEFMAYMLLALQKVKQEDIDEIRMLFDKFDKDNDGDIDKDDLRQSFGVKLHQSSNLKLRPRVGMSAAAFAVMSLQRPAIKETVLSE